MSAPGREREPIVLPPLLRQMARTIGHMAMGLLQYVGELVMLANRTVSHILRGEVTRREALEQMAAIGAGGIPLVAVTVAFSGMVFGIYSVQHSSVRRLEMIAWWFACR